MHTAGVDCRWQSFPNATAQVITSKGDIKILLALLTLTMVGIDRDAQPPTTGVLIRAPRFAKSSIEACSCARSVRSASISDFDGR
jgi:hypothetical protein